MLYGQQQLTGRERTFDKDEIIVTKTDLAGKITYANRTFYKLAGYKEKDCIGQQHNIIRHPEMPRAVFALLWQTIAAGEEIFAYVNNRAANGDHYWVLAHVTPSFDSAGNIIGYHSNRRVADKSVLETHIIPLYNDLLAIEKSEDSPKQGMQKAIDKVMDTLDANKLSFNQWIFSLGGL